jgi:hypothetical protein
MSNNLNVNNASKMTPAAARHILRTTRLSKISAMGKRGILLTAALLISATTPAESFPFRGKNNSQNTKSPNKASVLQSVFTPRTKMQKAKNVAATAAAVAAAHGGGWVGSLVALGPMAASYKEVYAAFSIFVLVLAIIYARIKQVNYRKAKLIEEGRARQREHNAAEREKNRQQVRNQSDKLMNMMMNMIPAIARGTSDPTIGRIAGPALALPISPLMITQGNAMNAARNVSNGVRQVFTNNYNALYAAAQRQRQSLRANVSARRRVARLTRSVPVNNSARRQARLARFGPAN